MVTVISLGGSKQQAHANPYSCGAEFTEVKEYDNVRGSDLSRIRNTITSEVLTTLTFDASTKWPSKSKMPTDITVDDLIEYGKDPGLGVRELHKKGHTGKGVSVALFDQPLMRDHEAYSNVDYSYHILNREASQESSMHGPAVMSILAGREIGIAPDARVYYYAYPSWKADQKNEADLFYDVIEKNKSLPEGQKIRVISMSHGVNPSFTNSHLLAEAEQRARDAGIIVVDVRTTRLSAVRAVPFANKDDPDSYVKVSWSRYSLDCLYVPAGRTTADGCVDRNNGYVVWEGGGLSWTVPYVAGVIALGVQVDPDLTEEQSIEYLYASGYDFHGGKLINPEGFIDLVTKNPWDVSLDKDYRFFLYNAARVSEDDMKAIADYADEFDDGIVNVLKDVSGLASAPDVYDMLRDEAGRRRGTLRGIQIFGGSDDVPAFDVHYKIQMQEGIDECGSFKSDFFYSNFASDSDCLRGDFSIYSAFDEKLNVCFVPEWTVSRLPLSCGEIAPYMCRVKEYAALTKDRPFGNIVNFSSPIFASDSHTDDFGQFLQNKIHGQFGILEKDDYRLYGNKQGTYPVRTGVAGDFTRENVTKENKEGIKEFIINAHGQSNNIDQCIYTGQERGSEKRVSFLNSRNINDVLSENYYDLDLWSCLNAHSLDGSNLVHEAMANGKCISAMAASSVISNNGARNDASLVKMKRNNFYYFYLIYFHSRALGNSRSESFHLAKQAYATEILKNTHMLGDGNYQFNLHNVLTYHYLGLIEYWDCAGKPGYKPQFADESVGNPNHDSLGGLDAEIEFDGNIRFNAQNPSEGVRVNYLKAERTGSRIRFTLNYHSPTDCSFSFFNPPNGDKIMKLIQGGIRKGTHTTTFYLSTRERKAMQDTRSITIKFLCGGEGNCINFDTEQLKLLLK